MFKLSQLSKFLHGRRRKNVSILAFEVPNEKQGQHLHCEPNSNNSRSRVQVTGRFEIFFRPKQFETQSLLWRWLKWPYHWDRLPLVGCMALGNISAKTMWNTKTIVAAIKSICRFWAQMVIILALGTNHLNFGYKSSAYETSVSAKRPDSFSSYVNSKLRT